MGRIYSHGHKPLYQ